MDMLQERILGFVIPGDDQLQHRILFFREVSKLSISSKEFDANLRG